MPRKKTAATKRLSISANLDPVTTVGRLEIVAPAEVRGKLCSGSVYKYLLDGIEIKGVVSCKLDIRIDHAVKVTLDVLV